MNDKRRVLKEFEWFEVQTKVRQIVGQILGPVQKKIMSNASSISRLDHFAKQEHQKIEYLTKMVNNDPEIFQHGVFSAVEQKIKEANVHIQQLQGKIVYLEDFINNKIEVLDRQLGESSEAIKGVNQFREYVKGELDNQNHKLVKSMQNLFTNFDSINQDITTLTVQVSALKTDQLTFSEQFNRSAEQMKENVLQATSTLDNFTLALKDIKVTADITARDAASLQEEMKRVGKFQKYTKQLQERIRMLSSEINNMEYKMEVVHPMIGLAQIFEYAHHFLPPQMHNNVSIYFYNHYRELIQSIVDNEIDKTKVGEAKRKALTFLKETHQKATKQVFKLKKAYFQAEGVDLESLSHDRRQEMLENLILKQEFGENTFFGSQLSPHRKQKEENNLTQQLQKQKHNLLTQLKQALNAEVKDSKLYILSMEDLLKREIGQLEKKTAFCEERCTKNEVELQLQATFFKQWQRDNHNNSKTTQQKLQQLEKSIRQTHGILTALKEIEKQDESDRYNMALLGVRERHRDQIKEYQEGLSQRKSPYELKESCLSCSGNPNYYNEFFKMACLTYASTPITLNNQVYERFELLDRIEKELEETAKTLLEQEKSVRKNSSEEKHSQKMSRYESNQVMRVPSREARSASDSFMVRNVSTSQEVQSKEKDVPRIIGSQELAEELMDKNRNRLCASRKQMGFREFKARKESHSKERTSYMINVSGFFRQLKKQQGSFLKEEGK